jgi:hypothetical protein
MPKRVSELPSHIFTSYLALSSIWISHEDTNVMLFGVYGDMVSGDIKPIMVETDFQSLNDLLNELGEDGEQVIEALAKNIMHPTEENEVIYTIEEGGLHFQDHLFALMINPQEEYEYDEWDEDDEEEDDDNDDGSEDWKEFEEKAEGEEGKVEDEIFYILNGYIKKNETLPDFLDIILPTEEAELVNYYNKLLAIQYRFYLLFKKIEPAERALMKSDLQSELVFVLAKANYGLVFKE